VRVVIIQEGNMSKTQACVCRYVEGTDQKERLKTRIIVGFGENGMAFKRVRTLDPEGRLAWTEWRYVPEISVEPDQLGTMPSELNLRSWLGWYTNPPIQMTVYRTGHTDFAIQRAEYRLPTLRKKESQPKPKAKAKRAAADIPDRRIDTSGIPEAGEDFSIRATA
jgi:hypothetical protein